MFSGLQNYEESNAVPDGKLYNCQNARFNRRVISSKHGFQILGNASVGGTKIQGIYDYLFLNGTQTQEKLVRFYNGAFEIFNEGTQLWDPVTTVWPNVADAFTDGVNFGNNIYFINPLTAAGNGVSKISNGTFSVINNSPRGTAIISWLSRLWAIGDPTSPFQVIASQPTISPATLSNVENWSTGQILESIGNGGRCVAMRVLNNKMFIFKEDSIYFNTAERIAGTETVFQELSRTGGASNQKSTIVVENDIWMLSQTQGLKIRRLGLEQQLGEDPRTRDLTAIIQASIDILEPIQDNPVMSYNKRLIKLSLKTKGSPTNNFTIIFDYDTGNYSIDRGQAVNVTAIWKGNLIYGEDATGQAFSDDTGFTANGAQFVFNASTPFMDDNRPDINKRARYIYFRGQQSYDQPVTVRLFRDGTYSTFSDYVIPSPRARGVALATFVNDGLWGISEWGQAPWGGSPSDTGEEIQMYRTEKLISIDRRSNLYALGVVATIDAGKVICEQLELKLIDDNENYKRSDL
jgi:hypothetical protein